MSGASHEVLERLVAGLTFAEVNKAEGGITLNFTDEKARELLASVRQLAPLVVHPRVMAERYYRLVERCSERESKLVVPWEKLPEDHRRIFEAAATAFLRGDEL